MEISSHAVNMEESATQFRVRPERQAMLREAYERNIDSGQPPYADIEIQSRDEVLWIIQERNWSGEVHDLTDLADRTRQWKHRIDLRRAILRLADLHDLHLVGADLQGANLEGAEASRALLKYADLSGANLKEVSVRDAILWHATLSGADLSYANLVGTDLLLTDLRGTNLNGVWMSDSTIFRRAD